MAAGKLHTSGFLLTINCQQSDDRYKQPLVDAVNGYLENIGMFLKHAPQAGELFDSKFTDKIISATLEPALEKNTPDPDEPDKQINNGSWHCHIYMSFKHRTRIHVNTKKTADYFRQEMGLSYTPYVNVKFVKDNAAEVRRYIHKAPREAGVVEN